MEALTYVFVVHRLVSIVCRENPDAGSKFLQEMKHRFDLFQIVTRAPLLQKTAAPPPSTQRLPATASEKAFGWMRVSGKTGSGISMGSADPHGASAAGGGGGNDGGPESHTSARKATFHMSGDLTPARKQSFLMGGDLLTSLPAHTDAAKLKAAGFFNGRVVRRRDRMWTDGTVRQNGAGEDDAHAHVMHDTAIRYPVLCTVDAVTAAAAAAAGESGGSGGGGGGTAHGAKSPVGPGLKVVEMTTAEVARDLWLVHPEEHWKHTYWDAFVGVIILYSVVMVPMELAFDSISGQTDDGSSALQHLWGISYFDFTVDGIFFLDICMNFQTTVFSERHDAYIGVRKLIAYTYCTSVWFYVDILSFFPFDTIIEVRRHGPWPMARRCRCVSSLVLFLLS